MAKEDGMDIFEGLGKDTVKAFPKLTKAQLEQSPIDRLGTDDKLHSLVKSYIVERITMSEREMEQFYPRWRVNEKKYQAYIDLPDWEKSLKALNEEGKPANPVAITIPYSFATVSTIVTFLFHTLVGRSPVFQVSARKGELTEGASMMEDILQYQVEHTRAVKKIYNMLNDTQMYGVGILRAQWQTTTAFRTVVTSTEESGFGGLTGNTKTTKVRKRSTVYEGNDIDSIDPFMFLPDPRVPMAEVNRRGEFVFWKEFTGKHTLKKEEAEGHIKYVSKASTRMPQSSESPTGNSNRNLITFGSAHAGEEAPMDERSASFYEDIQGTIEIVPAELGLGESKIPEKFVIRILNRDRIVQCEPFNADHDLHPVAVTEPYTNGYGFGNAGIIDYLNPIQDLQSWLVTSHMDNVKTALNNMWLIDPSKVEVQDFKKPGAGKLIRLKRSAYGTDVRQAAQQLPVVDVTSSHTRDLETITRIGDSMSSITDNLRGLQDSGGRKTATEARIGSEASGSRLATQARLISSQCLTDLAEMLSLNTQQHLSDDFFHKIVGEAGETSSIRLSPEMLIGDFHYPIHDGTLPLDRVAMLDVWKEILLGVSQDPELSQQYDKGSLFEFVAELGGAKNIEQFKINVVPDAELAAGIQSGQFAPAAEVMQNNTGQTPGLDGSNPSTRL